jgi:two-component system, cell cycle sensor histidine kinase and response regulator CckA
MALSTVKVPDSMKVLFEKAQEYVSSYFEIRKENPNKGSIFIGGEQYILVRAASMSVHFFDFIKNMYPTLNEKEAVEAASIVLYDLAHNIGKVDAKKFHIDTQVEDVISKLSTGPVHFSYTGWSYVNISEESNTKADETFYLLYDHPQSFEADSWISMGKETNFCTCFMNAGYFSGWCEESFGIPLVSKEILCRARGDKYCRFIMAQPHKLKDYIDIYLEKNQELFEKYIEHEE